MTLARYKVLIIIAAFLFVVSAERSTADDFGERFGDTSPLALEDNAAPFDPAMLNDISPAAGDEMEDAALIESENSAAGNDDITAAALPPQSE